MDSARFTSSYVTKFGGAALLVTFAVAAAATNVYTNLAPRLPPAAQSELLSGLLTVLLVFLIGVAFVTAAIGRETLSSLTVLTTRARQIERGDLDAELETNKGDELGELYRAFAAMRDALRSRIRETESRNQELQACAADYSAVMEEVGDGDLSQRLDEDVDIEAMAQLARDFNGMMDQLEATVGEVYAFTDDVATATSVLATQTEQSIRASAEVYRAAQTIAEEASTANAETLARLEDIENRADGTSRPVEGTEASGVEVEETIDAIESLSGQMDRIDEISEFIADVANETNMLALNAGIEASKVQSDGAEGFQVVAEEVKSLAEETRNGTDEIEAITDDIRGGTNDAVNSILRQQAALVSMMDDHVTELSQAAEDLRLSLSQLDVSELPETDSETETRLSPESEGEAY